MSTNLSNAPMFDVEKRLEGQDNWGAFKDQAHMSLRGRSLLGYLDGSIPRPATSSLPTTSTIFSSSPTPPNSRSPSAEEWELRDNYAAATIFQNVVSPKSHSLNVTDTCAQMWATLSDKFEYATELSRSMAEESLKSLKFHEGEDLTKHLNNLQVLRVNANNVGCTFTDARFIPVVFQSLPRSGMWALSIHVFQKEPKLDIILKGLIETWRYAGGVEKVDSTALASSSSSSSLPSNAPPIVCSNCRKRFHSVANCWAKGGGKEGQAPPGWRAPRGMEPVTKTVAPVIMASVASIPSYTTPLEIYGYSTVDMTDDGLDIPGQILPF